MLQTDVVAVRKLLFVFSRNNSCSNCSSNDTTVVVVSTLVFLAIKWQLSGLKLVLQR